MIDCRCPSCGSNNTQLAKLAYEQSMRHGKHFESTSEFTQRVAPPTCINPFLSILFGFFLWGGLTLVHRLGSLYPDHWVLSLFPNILLSLRIELSVTVSIGILFWLISMNARIYEVYQTWLKKWVCHRCGHQWLLHE